MRLLLIDNYDSFVYNLAQAFGSLGADPEVVRNDRDLEEIAGTRPDGIVISPGPGGPADAGISVAAIERFAGAVPILGVCLGHQCIAAAFGGVVERADAGPMHGKTAQVEHDASVLFEGLSSPFVATRYHSLAVTSVPSELQVSARSEDGTIMALRHRELDIFGVQFHPESVLCEQGPRLLGNFLDLMRS